MAQGLDIEHLMAAGWQPADLAWEAAMEAGLAAWEDRDVARAGTRWGEALGLAREHFADNDPRLAASLANWALVLIERDRAASGAALMVEAGQVLGRAEGWLQGLRPERRARSALYHLRLQRRYPGGYDGFSRKRYLALLEEARARLATLRRDGSSACARLAVWRQRRPEGFDDARKLTAAALLLA